MVYLKSTLMGVTAALLSLVLLTGCSSSRHGTVLHRTAYDTSVTSRTGDHSTLALAEAADLIGMDIVGSDGETVGVLDDIVVHRNDGKIAYGVLAYGGFMGLGEDFHAVPWNAFRVTNIDGKRVLAVNFTERSLEGVRGFDKHNWPLTPTFTAGAGTASIDFSAEREGADADVVDRGVDNYGYVGDSAHSRDTRVYSDAAGVKALVANGQLVRLSKLIGWDFHHTEGNIGEVKEAVIDMNHGQLAYLVIDFNGKVDELDDRVAVVPWNAVTLLPRDNAVALRGNYDASDLVAISYHRGSLPDLADPGVSQRLYSQYEVRPYWDVYGFTGDDTSSEGTHGLERDMNR